MSISFIQLLVSAVCFGLGYYVKARFEINQEDTILKLQLVIEQMKKEHKEKEKELRYELWQLGQLRDQLESEMQKLYEKIKDQQFKEIAKESKENTPMTKALMNFL